jgi:hypothetical protein
MLRADALEYRPVVIAKPVSTTALLRMMRTAVGGYARPVIRRFITGFDLNKCETEASFTRYFRSGSARCSQIPPGESLPSPGLPDTCLKESWICPDGKWTQFGSECKFDRDDVPIYVTAEQCVTGGAVQATVTGISVRYYPGECECQSNANCQGGSRSVCNPASYSVYVSEADPFHVNSVNLCMLPE